MDQPQNQNMAAASAKKLTAGADLAAMTIELDRQQIRNYAQASADSNPIHVDDQAAQKLGLPGAIAHGMWTMGAALTLLEKAGIATARITCSSCRFVKPLVLAPEAEKVTVVVIGKVKKVEADIATVLIEVQVADSRVAKVEVNICG